MIYYFFFVFLQTENKNSFKLTAVHKICTPILLSRKNNYKNLLLTLEKNMIRKTILFLCFCTIFSLKAKAAIDRHALVTRNNPVVNTMDTLSSLSVGNGDFAFTVDATGLQSFPEYYKRGVCLGTQTQWGWHSFPNTGNYRFEEVLKAFDFGHHSKKELYACQFKTPERQHEASECFRINPHRLHMGIVGFDFSAVRNNVKATDICDIYQHLNLWEGIIYSHFSLDGQRYSVQTTCSPNRDLMSAHVVYEPSFAGVMKPHAPIELRLPYPTGGHVDDACNWNAPERHSSSIIASGKNYAVVSHTLDATQYFIIIRWNGEASFSMKKAHTYILLPKENKIGFSVEFIEGKEGKDAVADLAKESYVSFETVAEESREAWKTFWTKGAAVDFSRCKDARAKELERRVVLSQYLLAIQSAGSIPPQETGLTMNSWYGKFHLEMILWHEAWLPLWGHAEKLAKTLEWYETVEPVAREIAKRQGFEGIRWMKMTDPSGIEAPSNVGSFLIWQQPHLIYLAELVYRSTCNNDFLRRFSPLVDKTAQFMYSFANYDKQNKRFILRGNIPAQESLKAAVTVNSPFELSQWLTTLSMAQDWRERCGEKRNKDWDRLINLLSPLAFNEDSLYLAAESAKDTYTNIKATSDHPALLGALGFFPESRLVNKEIMNHTLDWIIANWNWPTSWGWDFPMTAMTATRLLKPEKAVDALLLNVQKNTYLNNGHNYQSERLRLYLPGNGGLLSAIALMCAGWDGCTVKNPGFPKDGNWDVQWEGLAPLP